MKGVYIHIPFCEKKCSYCAFSSFVMGKDKIDEYILHLTKEIRKRKGEEVDTIYIGGGTPSLLDESQIKDIFSALNETFKISKDAEITIECNPNSLTKEKAKLYKKLGINRISIGVQSLDDDKLNFVGRKHNSIQAKESIILAQKCGFENISADLLIGLKGEKEESFLRGLKTLIELGVKHISTYMLQIEDKTPLKKMVEENANLLPTDEENVDIFEKTAKFLRKNGFLHYEVSNFAKKGFESRHNKKYWSGEEYIGFGLSAHSFENGIRYANANTFKDYYQGKIALKEYLTDKQKIEEHIMLGLRCDMGIDIKYLEKLNFYIKENENYKDFIEKGILIEENDKTILSPDYYVINNYIIVNLLPFWKNEKIAWFLNSNVIL